MNKHTRGPWTAIADSGEDSEGDWYVLNDQEAAIAVGLYGPDARLIAAAPDLLAALKIVEDASASWLTLGERAQIRAAIAKAEGVS